ncbi:MAG: hypothetical protein ACLSDQ_00520 [Adlercreutzia equolifaciens]
MENDPLAAYLAALARDDCYRVDEVLKTVPTRRPKWCTSWGPMRRAGPFVRKRIAVDAAGCLRPLVPSAARRAFRHLPRIYDVHTTGDKLVVVMNTSGRTLRTRCTSATDRSPWRAVVPVLCDG